MVHFLNRQFDVDVMEIKHHDKGAEVA